MHRLPLVIAVLSLSVWGATVGAQSPPPVELSTRWMARVTAGSGVGIVSEIAASPTAVFLTGGGHPGVNTLIAPPSGVATDLGFEIAFYGGVSADGTALWLEPSAGTPFALGYHVATAAGAVITGEGAFPDLDIPAWAVGSTVLTARDPTTGQVRWSRSLGVSVEAYEPQTNAVVKRVAVEPNGAVFVVGLFRDTLTLGSDVLVASPGGEPGLGDPYDPTAPFDVFLARLSPEGVPVWGVAVGGAGAEWISSDPLAAQGAMSVGEEVYITGAFPGGSTVRRGGPATGPEMTIPSGAVVLAFNRNGDVSRVVDREALEVSTVAYPYAVAAAPSSSGEPGFALAWWFPRADGAGRAVVTVGGQSFTDPGSQGVFVSRHTADGHLVWAVPFTGEGTERVGGLALGSDGRTWVGGDFDGPSLTLGGVALRRSGNGDGFVAAVGPDGVVEGYIHASGPEIDRIQSVAVSPDGTAYAAGNFKRTTEIGGLTVSTTNRGREAFVVQLGPPVPVPAEPPPPEGGYPMLTVWPNPARSVATAVLDTGGARTGSVRVFDILGRLVVEARLVDIVSGFAQIPLDLKVLPPGLYVVRATLEGGSKPGISMTLTVID